MVLAGLTSSSVNNGSRTDMGLGRSILTISQSGSNFLLIGEYDGDTDGEDDIPSSSDGAWEGIKRILNVQSK